MGCPVIDGFSVCTCLNSCLEMSSMMVFNVKIKATCSGNELLSRLLTLVGVLLLKTRLSGFTRDAMKSESACLWACEYKEEEWLLSKQLELWQRKTLWLTSYSCMKKHFSFQCYWLFPCILAIWRSGKMEIVI